LQVSKEVEGLLAKAVFSEVGNGANTLFWCDKWLNGRSIRDIAPSLFALVPKRKSNKRTVLEALTNDKWVEDLQGDVSVEALMEYLTFWDLLQEVELQQDSQDKLIWRLSPTGVYSASSAYEALFQGAVLFGPFERIWKSWAPPKCRFFMWLVAHQRCWTADWLAKRGLPHPDFCPLCDQEEENIQHLLVGCLCKRILVSTSAVCWSGGTHTSTFCPLCDQEEENIQHFLVGCLCKRILVSTSAVCWSGGTHTSTF
jgi:hypothetical protein